MMRVSIDERVAINFMGKQSALPGKLHHIVLAVGNADHRFDFILCDQVIQCACIGFILVQVNADL